MKVVPKRGHLGAKMLPEGILRGLRGAIECPGEAGPILDSISDKVCGNPAVLRGLGAARNLKPDPADLPDPANPADLPEMVHSRHFGP